MFWARERKKTKTSHDGVGLIDEVDIKNEQYFEMVSIYSQRSEEILVID